MNKTLNEHQQASGGSQGDSEQEPDSLPPEFQAALDKLKQGLKELKGRPERWSVKKSKRSGGSGKPRS